MEIGPTGAQLGHSDPKDIRYCARFDGREMIRRAIAAQSEYLVMWVRDGDYAYYHSRLLPKAAGLGQRDPLRQALDEARPHRLPVIAYCVVQQGGQFLKAHPEYQAVLSLRDPPKSVRAWSSSTKVRRRGHRVELAIENIHEVVTVRY